MLEGDAFTAAAVVMIMWSWIPIMFIVEID